MNIDEQITLTSERIEILKLWCSVPDKALQGYEEVRAYRIRIELKRYETILQEQYAEKAKQEINALLP